MAILSIVQDPDPTLRKEAEVVPLGQIQSPRIRKLIKEMKETLSQTPDGVGLAAPQVGQSLRIFIVSEEAEEIDRAEQTGAYQRDTEAPPYERRPWKYYVFINPVLKSGSRKQWEDPEGCLSVPGRFGLVKRREKITIDAYDEEGKKITRGASRFFARVMQHELDHLGGMLFTDKTKRMISLHDYKH